MSVQNQIPKTSIFGALRALNLLFLSFPSIFEKCLLKSVFWTSENERCVYLSQCLLKSFTSVIVGAVVAAALTVELELGVQMVMSCDL